MLCQRTRSQDSNYWLAWFSINTHYIILWNFLSRPDKICVLLYRVTHNHNLERLLFLAYSHHNFHQDFFFFAYSYHTIQLHYLWPTHITIFIWKDSEFHNSDIKLILCDAFSQGVHLKPVAYLSKDYISMSLFILENCMFVWQRHHSDMKVQFCEGSRICRNQVIELLIVYWCCEQK